MTDSNSSDPGSLAPARPLAWAPGEFQNLSEALHRRFRLAIDVNEIPQLLQRAKDEERVDEQREKLADGDALREDQVEHQEKNGGAQQIYHVP